MFLISRTLRHIPRMDPPASKDQPLTDTDHEPMRTGMTRANSPYITCPSPVRHNSMSSIATSNTPPGTRRGMQGPAEPQLDAHRPVKDECAAPQPKELGRRVRTQQVGERVRHVHSLGRW
ncbi:uncharacterized protein B0H18DRAFT_597738 [Fomitopsis serialis]|uniref:uncharacterized protein n=1 Tax=Fomitopsis serialis TaxID=139415 RepID=UPI002008103E|nr:uncharacterized protein B0H18DRAFT_597738 [Neoantrodia serialis]KAH9920378.1 hypothetical protein B0H18DRAFT_597738 [Neoantrodia serialis]